MNLSKKQTIALDFLEDNITREVGFGGGAGGGKSVLGCYWQLKRRLKYPETAGLIGRASLKTLKETTLQSFFFVAAQQNLEANVHYRYNAQSSQILFPNGSVIYLKDLFLYPSDPNFDELGSLEITDLFIDETSQVSKKAWDIARSRIRYNLDKYDLVPKALWTSNPSKNWNYSEFYQPYKKGELDESKQFIQSLVSDNPEISKHYIDNLNSLDEVDRERLLLGNWEYDFDPAKLITFDAILDSFSNAYVSNGTKYISADIARFGSDKAVVIVWDGLVVKKIVTRDKSSVTELSELISNLAKEYHVQRSNIVCDEDGVGGGVVDILKCKGFVNGSRPLKENFEVVQYNNLKSQCYFKLSKYINEGKIWIQDDTYKESIVKELEQIKRDNIDKDGKLSILSKDKMKLVLGKSPDYADALMMRMYFELASKIKVRQSRITTPYDR